MEYSFRLLVLGFTFSFVSARQVQTVEQTWVRADQKLIGSVTLAMKAGPTQVEHLFRQRGGLKKAEGLGFGWSYKEARVGSGYISVRGTLYYQNGHLVSYILYPELPREQSLVAQYRSWYAKGFPVTPEEVAPFRFNPGILQQPLPPYEMTSDTHKSSRILHYMSPESGTEYGYNGGFAGMLLDNRASFLALQSQLRPQDILLMMHAVNPASRLTAIEYYWRNKTLFANRVAIDQWIERVFNELPQVDTMNGCLSTKSSARNLVKKYSQVK